MKKGNALQYALIITGIVMGYNAFQTFVAALWSLGNWLYEGGNGASHFFPRFSDYVFLILQSAACWLLIMRSGNISVYISERTNTIGNFNVSVNSRNLLRILLTAMGIYFLLVNIPHVLNDALNGFGSDREYMAQGVFFASSRYISVIQLVLSVFLTAYAGNIAAYFAGKMTDEPITIEQEIEEINTDNSNAAL
jgi:hypothetical protein